MTRLRPFLYGLLMPAALFCGMPAAAADSGDGPGGLSRSPSVTGSVTAAQVLADDRWQQVRIERRVIIRITPADPGLLPPPQVYQPLPMITRFHERRMPKCVTVMDIAGVRPLSENRLLLIMRDRRLVGADLARTCTARDFYMGFYVAPTPDGQLCIDRDTIHSRSGSTCTIAKVHELVPRN